MIRLQLNSNTEKKQEQKQKQKTNTVVQGGSFQRKGALTFLTEKIKHICETKL